MNLPIHSLNTRLVTFLEKENIPLGLADGKMGFCIYFYYLSSVYTNTNYKKIAGKLLDDIFDNIDTLNSIDVKNGLAGIGLGVDYLIRNNYVKGNVNVILNDIDDVIFKNLSYSKYIEKKDALSLIHILYYLCIRWKSQKTGSENGYLFKELIIQTVNNLYEQIDYNFYEEPFAYNIDYPLPQLLFVLSKIYSLNLYNYRVIKIIEELNYKVLSLFPLLHCNRLYLLWGMSNLNKQINDNKSLKHIKLLKSQIDFKHILNNEIKNRNVHFNDGLTSMYYLISSLTDCLTQKKITFIQEQIIGRIKLSDSWTALFNDPQYFNEHTGLYNGFTGVNLLLNTTQTHKHSL